MISVGITGQAGFIGSHLYNYLGQNDQITRIPFQDEFFQHPEQLQEFVKKCEVIVHLAGVNRHADPDTLYRTNLDLVNLLLQACEATGSKPHIIFSSSTQEERDNEYGRSKRDSRQILEKWAQKNSSRFTGLIIPNVFGPFGKPFYNSVVSTFCHQLTHNEQPEIHIDGTLNLIYVGELMKEFERVILWERDKKNKLTDTCIVPHSATAKVSEILSILLDFKDLYLEKQIIPDLSDPFHLNLFNTFRCYVPPDYYPVKYSQHTDDRGSFVEVLRSQNSGQNSYSTTRPGITRGNHYHTRKVERFSVIKGKARIQLRRIGTDEIIEYFMDGKNPAFVDMPVWHTHNITNIGKDDLLTLFWINEPYDPEDPDTFFEDV
jgi:UDP-2-acetamido-2,6-beta-L-arabino-hexul-4-ose reductase